MLRLVEGVSLNQSKIALSSANLLVGRQITHNISWSGISLALKHGSGYD